MTANNNPIIQVGVVDGWCNSENVHQKTCISIDGWKKRSILVYLMFWFFFYLWLFFFFFRRSRNWCGARPSSFHLVYKNLTINQFHCITGVAVNRAISVVIVVYSYKDSRLEQSSDDKKEREEEEERACPSPNF